jgi:hypothetical protein
MVKYKINTKQEGDSETKFPYINPSPLNLTMMVTITDIIELIYGILICSNTYN